MTMTWDLNFDCGWLPVTTLKEYNLTREMKLYEFNVWRNTIARFFLQRKYNYIDLFCCYDEKVLWSINFSTRGGLAHEQYRVEFSALDYIVNPLHKSQAWQRALGVNGMKSVKDQRLRAEYHARFCAKQLQERLARSYSSLQVPDCDCKEGQARMKRKLEAVARVL